MHCPCSAAPGPVDGTSRTLPEPADTPRRLPAANTEDPVTPPSAVRAWRTAYPSAKYVRYRYGGHIQVPDEAAARIARWVERSGG
ncbi:alpha/beta fold hydrolase [Streptomyces sp. NPDC006294]